MERQIMTRKAMDDLGALQKEIMEIVWDAGEATARQVQEIVGLRKKLAYTSVLSMMQRLEKYGWLKHRIEGRTHVYQATMSRKQESGRSLKEFIQRVFHGNTRLFFEYLTDEEGLSEDDLKALQNLIQQRRKGKKK